MARALHHNRPRPPCAALFLIIPLWFPAAADGQTRADTARADSARTAFLATARAAAAAPPTPAPIPSVKPPADSVAATVAAPVVDSVLEPSVRMGQRIRLRTRNVDTWAKAGNHDTGKLVLYLDGRAMKGVAVNRVSPATPETWEARLRRDSAGADAWEALLGSPNQMTRNVQASLGPPVGPQFAADSVKARVNVVIVRRPWFYATLVFWLTMLGLFYYLARNTGIIRDSAAPEGSQDTPPTPPDARAAALPGNPAREKRRAFAAVRAAKLEQRPYSLGRFQMAVWFFVVTAAFLGIWLITGEFSGIITPQVLVLLGLSTTAAIGARAVEAGRRREQQAGAQQKRVLEQDKEIAQQAAAAGVTSTDAASAAVQDIDAHIKAVVADTAKAPASKGFFLDILNENDEIALHRFQHFAWTLILAVIFIYGAYQTLAMPALDNYLMILLGISGLTYVGFKAAEPHS